MSDAEWEAWRSKWSSTEGPLPDVRARARQQAARHRRGNIIFFSLMAFGVLANLFGQDDPLVRWLVISWSVVIVAAFLWIQRGPGLTEDATPRETLAFLERRVLIERRSAQVARWVYPPLMLFVAIYYRDLLGEGDDAWVAKLVARALVLVIAAIVFSAPWWMRRFTDRQQREIELWRRWMDEQQL